MLGPLLFITFIEKIEKISCTAMSAFNSQNLKIKVGSINDVMLKNLIKISRGKDNNTIDGFPFVVVVFNIINRSLELIQKVRNKSNNQL